MKNLSKIIFILAFVLLFSFGLNAMAAEVILRAAHNCPIDHAFQKGLEYFAEKVKEYSGGEAEVIVYGNAILGQTEDYYQNMMQGTLDFSIAAPAIGSAFAKELDFLELPYLFKNKEHWKAVLDGDVGREFEKIIEDAIGLKILLYTGGSSRNIVSRVGPINKPEDLKGFLIRVMNSPLQIEFWKTVGASPTPTDYAEVYSALQQGVLDGFENEMPTIYAGKFYEVAKYISLTEHIFTVRPLFMSGKTWNRLTKNVQDAIVKAADDAVEVLRNLEQAEAEDAIKVMQDKFGVKINKIENKDWMIEKTRSIRIKASTDFDTLDLLKEIEEIGKKY